LVAAINGLASIAFAPEALRTSGEEIHAFRLVLNATMPHFIGTSDTMSPAEAVFVTGFLTQQKLFDPTFKVDPQKAVAWAASRHAEHTFRDTHEHVLGDSGEAIRNG